MCIRKELNHVTYQRSFCFVSLSPSTPTRQHVLSGRLLLPPVLLRVAWVLKTVRLSPVFFRQSAPYKLSANLLTPTLPCLSSLIPSLLPVRLSSLSSLRMSSLPASLPACELSPTLLFFLNFLLPACLTSSFPYHTAALFLLICLL